MKSHRIAIGLTGDILDRKNQIRYRSRQVKSASSVSRVHQKNLSVVTGRDVVRALGRRIDRQHSGGR